MLSVFGTLLWYLDTRAVNSDIVKGEETRSSQQSVVPRALLSPPPGWIHRIGTAGVSSVPKLPHLSVPEPSTVSPEGTDTQHHGTSPGYTRKELICTGKGERKAAKPPAAAAHPRAGG